MGFREGLRRTRERFGAGFARLTHLGASIDATTLEQIETLLLEADVGVETTERIIVGLAPHVKCQLSRTDWLLKRYARSSFDRHPSPVRSSSRQAARAPLSY